MTMTMPMTSARIHGDLRQRLFALNQVQDVAVRIGEKYGANTFGIRGLAQEGNLTLLKPVQGAVEIRHGEREVANSRALHGLLRPVAVGADDLEHGAVRCLHKVRAAG